MGGANTRNGARSSLSRSFASLTMPRRTCDGAADAMSTSSESAGAASSSTHRLWVRDNILAGVDVASTSAMSEPAAVPCEISRREKGLFARTEMRPCAGR